MSAGIVILLLILAISLVLIEIFIVPGIGIPGIAGAVLMFVSLYLAYEVSTTFGHYTLIGTSIASAGLIFLAFRAKTWERLSLKSDIEGKVGPDHIDLSVGEEGMTISRLNPIGKAMFKDRYYEVRSKGAFIDERSAIEIVNIEGNKITVTQK